MDYTDVRRITATIVAQLGKQPNEMSNEELLTVVSKIVAEAIALYERQRAAIPHSRHV